MISVIDAIFFRYASLFHVGQLGFVLQAVVVLKNLPITQREAHLGNHFFESIFTRCKKQSKIRSFFSAIQNLSFQSPHYLRFTRKSMSFAFEALMLRRMRISSQSKSISFQSSACARSGEVR